ncbi:hypothetical protein CerSpe_129230 [Prunus speciosa]
MKFGKEFRIRTLQEETLPDWRDKFLSDKRLKELVNHLPPPPPQLPPILSLIISTLSNSHQMPTLRTVAVRMPTSSPTFMH